MRPYFKMIHGSHIAGMLKTGGSLAVSHPLKEVEDGNMADYHLLSEETGSPSFKPELEGAVGFLILNLSQ